MAKHTAKLLLALSLAVRALAAAPALAVPPPHPRPTPHAKAAEPKQKTRRVEPERKVPVLSGPPALVVFGGGWGPEGTQASIEAHVEGLTAALGPKHPQILFASGDPKKRDVQVPSRVPDEVGELLGLVFDRLDNVDVDYRPARLPEHRAASRDGLLAAIGGTRGSAGGTVVLGVGHGGAAQGEVPASLELYGPDDRLAVDELARYLDGESRRAPIAFVLGQCHSGAFVDLMFEEGIAKDGEVADPVRCVLAAVPGDREAAGCTPDLGDPDARSYMAVIAEAFARPRSADLDHDGKVTLAEAHAFARIQDRTVDVPVSTSEAWLERVLGQKAPKPETVALPKLLERARPTERAVLEAFAPGGIDRDTSRRVLAEIDAMNEKLSKLDQEVDDLDADRDRIRRRILDVVLTRWPELASPYHAASRKLLAGDAKDVVDLIRAQREVGELRERELSIRAKDHERLELEKKKARLDRWLRALTAVASEDALRRSTNRRAIAILDQLLACESMAP